MQNFRKRGIAGLVLAVAATGSYALPASANPAGTGLVISEVYGGGGSSSSLYLNDYVELYNPTGSAISVDGWSVQYRSAGGNFAQVTGLSGSVPSHGHYLVQEGAGGAGAPLPVTPDATGGISMSGSNGVVLLVPSTTPFSTQGDLAGNAGLVDMVGYGTTPTSYETAPTGTALNVSTAAIRKSDSTDTDNNSADFSTAAPQPQNSGSTTPPPTSRSRRASPRSRAPAPAARSPGRPSTRRAW
jgi:predicted extracellular nuclease